MGIALGTLIVFFLLVVAWTVVSDYVLGEKDPWDD